MAGDGDHDVNYSHAITYFGSLGRRGLGWLSGVPGVTVFHTQCALEAGVTGASITARSLCCPLYYGRAGLPGVSFTPKSTTPHSGVFAGLRVLGCFGNWIGRVARHPTGAGPGFFRFGL